MRASLIDCNSMLTCLSVLPDNDGVNVVDGHKAHARSRHDVNLVILDFGAVSRKREPDSSRSFLWRWIVDVGCNAPLLSSFWIACNRLRRRRQRHMVDGFVRRRGKPFRASESGKLVRRSNLRFFLEVAKRHGLGGDKTDE